MRPLQRTVCGRSIFSTLVQEDMREIIKRANGLFLDFFDAFLGPLEQELEVKSSRAQGKAHGMPTSARTRLRIDATNFALADDDGAITRDYDRADLVLIGVSRSGKTPTCLYMAMQYGIFAANFPFTEDEFETGAAAGVAAKVQRKLYRTDDRAGAPAADPQRAAPGQQVFLVVAVRIRSALGRGHLQTLRHSVHQHDRMLDRRNREPHHRQAGSNAGCGRDASLCRWPHAKIAVL